MKNIYQHVQSIVIDECVSEFKLDKKEMKEKGGIEMMKMIDMNVLFLDKKVAFYTF